MIKEMKEDYDIEETDAGVDVKCGLLMSLIHISQRFWQLPHTRWPASG